MVEPEWMKLRTLLAVVVVATACLTVPGAAPALAEPNRSALALPQPTGPFPVGLSTLHLRDETRRDIWKPEERRELMVSLWYPALAPIGWPARYVTAHESTLLVRAFGATGVPPEVLSTVRTHSRVGAPPLPRRLPLVVLSPGFSFPRSTLTSLAEDLASRGYAVAAIDHNYEAVAITFPDGSVTECYACTVPRNGADASKNRAADVSFVLDQLTGKAPVWWGARLIDTSRIAMVGHSLGGSSAVAAMRTDPRIDAGVNMDGTFQVPATGLARPFLLFGAPAHQPGGRDASWDRTWAELSGWKRWLTVAGAGHSFCTDIHVLADQLGLPPAGEQTLPGTRGVEIARAYVGAFVDRHLRDRSRPLLDRPSSRFPEVAFHATVGTPNGMP
jgi:dienelactone hydrolase